jgi:hypothetical protein
MRAVLGSLLLLSVGLNGQSTEEDKAAAGKLYAILAALKNSKADKTSLAQQLRDEMMALADSDRKPLRATVSGFANEFADALFGKNLTNAQVRDLQSSVIGLLRGARANISSASRLRETLVAIHIDDSKTRRITRIAIAIGEEIRGPDDHGLELLK